MSAILAGHKRSNEHLSNFQKWKEIELRLKTKKTIDEENVCLIKQEEKYRQQILEQMVALVRVSRHAKSGLLGNTQKTAHIWQWELNFLKLALFDPFMDEDLHKIRDNETHAHYLGKGIQNELIQLSSNTIKGKNLNICQVVFSHSRLYTRCRQC
jgi:hypothetical protein